MPVSTCWVQVRSLQSLVAEKTSCITLLQRELEHKQASLTAAQEKMEALTERTNTTISNLQVSTGKGGGRPCEETNPYC